MNIVCIVRKGKDLSHTLASIKFGQYGESLNIPYVICDSWEEGFQKSNEYTHGLFIDSGTIFYDLQKFIKDINNFPHQGCIGHIIDPKNPDEYYYLDSQCFFVDLRLFCIDDFAEEFSKQDYVPVRSVKNIHHDYTPLWIRKSKEMKFYSGMHFGSNLISKMFKLGKIVVNFSNVLRSQKQFLYNDELKNKWLEFNKDYLSIASDQLWILNNEPIHLDFKNRNLITPGSGFFWMLAAQSPIIDKLDIVDISTTQINFVETLLKEWNGIDYGEFVIDFMEKNSVTHYNLDKDITKLERIKFKNRKLLKDYINNKCPNIDWHLVKTKKITLHNENIVSFILHQQDNSDVWMSNILDYKFTFLTTTHNEIEQFDMYLKKFNCL